MLKFNESWSCILIFSIFFRVFRGTYCRFLKNGPVEEQCYPFIFDNSNIKLCSRGSEWSSMQFGTCCLMYYSAFKGKYPCLATSLGLLQGVFRLSVLLYKHLFASLRIILKNWHVYLKVYVFLEDLQLIQRKQFRKNHTGRN